MRVLILSIFILLQACNPNRGHDVATTGQAVGKGFEAIGVLFQKLDEVVSDFEYDGEYAAGARNGYGTYTWKDKKNKGTKYVGYHKDNKFHGDGVMTMPDGSVYTGRWDKDQFVEGVYTYANGTNIEGIWENGALQYEMHTGYLTAVANNASAAPEIKTASQTDAASGFWGNTDKFLSGMCGGVSKKDEITGLRTIDSPFHNEDYYRAQGQQTLNLIKKKAKSDGVKIFSSNEPEYQRVKSIVDRLVDASHYRNHKDKVQYEVIDYEDFQAYAFGGGYFVVFSGLLKQTNDDELAFIIAHELAHNTAGHIEESYFLKVKDVFGDKPTDGYSTSFTNVNEQEADRVAIIYTALAGFNPTGGATVFEKRPETIEAYTFYRTHPANTQRAKAIRQASSRVMKYYTAGVVNPNAAKVLKCNELFCNQSVADNFKEGEGAGLFKCLEVLVDAADKNEKIKQEKKAQEQEIIQSRAIVLQTPPNIKWAAGWNVFRGTIERHNQKAGLNFGIANGQGEFYYNFDNKVQQGVMQLSSQNEHGYWFNWQDNWGRGRLLLREYTDGSLRGQIYMDNGTNPGELLGEFVGFK